MYAHPPIPHFSRLAENISCLAIDKLARAMEACVAHKGVAAPRGDPTVAGNPSATPDPPRPTLLPGLSCAANLSQSASVVAGTTSSSPIMAEEGGFQR